MNTKSALYQLMDIRVNDGLDEILKNDEEYQQISKQSNEYLDRLAQWHFHRMSGR